MGTPVDAVGPGEGQVGELLEGEEGLLPPLQAHPLPLQDPD